MTAAVWTIRNALVGAQQPDAVSDEKKHPLGTRISAVSLVGVETRFIYGISTAALAAGAAATFNPATGNIAAGAASAIDGTVIPAVAVGQYVWLKIADEV